MEMSLSLYRIGILGKFITRLSIINHAKTIHCVAYDGFSPRSLKYHDVVNQQ